MCALLRSYWCMMVIHALQGHGLKLIITWALLTCWRFTHPDTTSTCLCCLLRHRCSSALRQARLLLQVVQRHCKQPHQRMMKPSRADTITWCCQGNTRYILAATSEVCNPTTSDERGRWCHLWFLIFIWADLQSWPNLVQIVHIGFQQLFPPLETRCFFYLAAIYILYKVYIYTLLQTIDIAAHQSEAQPPEACTWFHQQSWSTSRQWLAGFHTAVRDFWPQEVWKPTV